MASAHKNARRLDGSRPPGADSFEIAEGALEHPEHDGANKGDGCIRGNNAHFADQRTQQGHREISVVTSLPAQLSNLPKRSRRKKSGLLHYCHLSTAWNGGNVVKEV